MKTAQELAYLGGLVDGDGYLKITKSPPRGRKAHPYYGITVGVQQMMPGEAVRLFAATFSGKVMPPTSLPGHKAISRCEVHARKAEAALRRLLPYLLVKKDQALVLLAVMEIRRTKDLDMNGYFERLENLRNLVTSLHEGSGRRPGLPSPIRDGFDGYSRLGPAELGWTHDQIHAYLAGIMDSDGSFRVEKRNVAGMLHPQYRINVRCAQVAPSRAVELLARTFGGGISIRHDSRSMARDLVVWSLHDRSAVPAITSLLPHLIVKQREAWLLLELRRLKEAGKKGLSKWVHANRWHDHVHMRKRHYTSRQVAAFERIYHQVQDLHAGPPPSPAVAYVSRRRSSRGRSTVPAPPDSAGCPTSACRSPSRSRSPRGGR